MIHYPGEDKWRTIPAAIKFSAGLPEDEMGISAADIGFLNNLIIKHPEYRLFIEFGTFRGITALVLSLAMSTRGGHLVTIDDRDLRMRQVMAAWPMNARFQMWDLLPPDGGVDSNTERLIRSEPCIVFCDNGNKPEELRRYGPVLKAGDCLTVHDWRDPDYPDAEISPPRCPSEMFDSAMWRQEDWILAEAMGSAVRAWIKL